jgi:peptidoglycan/LPS O-acetylase OafA/YrhL
MNTKEILKRTYYALVSGVLMLASVWLLGITANDGNFHVVHPVLFPVIVIVLALVFCWIMTRHNRREGVILLSVVAVTAVIAAIGAVGGFNLGYDGYILPSWGVTMLCPCAACMMVTGFLSDTKYHNILPNQSKGVSTLFRVLSWIGQIGIWGLGVAILLTALGVIK